MNIKVLGIAVTMDELRKKANISADFERKKKVLEFIGTLQVLGQFSEEDIMLLDLNVPDVEDGKSVDARAAEVVIATTTKGGAL
ncbi:hypothetical protein Pfo_003608 [Paulownia fortunei]|nr:hypothetical protein Pfo_003608 [Paulownia fortunei]